MTRHVLETCGPRRSRIYTTASSYGSRTPSLRAVIFNGLILRSRSAEGRRAGGPEIENCSIDCGGMLLMEKILNAGSESRGRKRLRPSPAHAGHGAAALLVTTIRRAYELFAANDRRLMAVVNCLAEATGMRRRDRDRQRGRNKISREREKQKQFGDPSIHVQPAGSLPT